MQILSNLKPSKSKLPKVEHLRLRTNKHVLFTNLLKIVKSIKTLTCRKELHGWDEEQKQRSPSIVVRGCRRKGGGQHNLRVGRASVRGVACLRAGDKAAPSAMKVKWEWGRWRDEGEVRVRKVNGVRGKKWSEERVKGARAEKNTPRDI